MNKKFKITSLLLTIAIFIFYHANIANAELNEPDDTKVTRPQTGYGTGDSYTTTPSAPQTQSNQGVDPALYPAGEVGTPNVTSPVRPPGWVSTLNPSSSGPRQSEEAGLTVYDTRGQRIVVDTAPKLEATDIGPAAQVIGASVQAQGAQANPSQAATTTGGALAAGGAVSVFSGISNFTKARTAGKRSAVFKDASLINEQALRNGNYNNANELIGEITSQRAAAAAYATKQSELKAKGWMDTVAGAGLLGTGILNFYMAKKLKDGGGDPNDPFPPPPGPRPDDPYPVPPDLERFDRTPTDDTDLTEAGEGTNGGEQSAGDQGSGGGGSGSEMAGGGSGKFPEDSAGGDKSGEKKDEKKVDTGAEEKVLGSYGDSGGRDIAGAGGGGMGDLSGMGGDGFDSQGLDSLLASLMPQNGEENALFGPDLDPNKINEQDIDLFASIKKTHIVFYPEWKKLDNKKKEQPKKEEAVKAS